MISNELQEVSGGGKEHTRTEGGKKGKWKWREGRKKEEGKGGRARAGDTGRDHYYFIKQKTSNRTHPGLNA